jgi:hypothetical protein
MHSKPASGTWHTNAKAELQGWAIQPNFASLNARVSAWYWALLARLAGEVSAPVYWS